MRRTGRRARSGRARTAAGRSSARCHLGLAVELSEATAEHLPFDAASFDTVVRTLSLCRVVDDEAAIAETCRWPGCPRGRWRPARRPRWYRQGRRRGTARPCTTGGGTARPARRGSARRCAGPPRRPRTADTPARAVRSRSTGPGAGAATRARRRRRSGPGGQSTTGRWARRSVPAPTPPRPAARRVSAPRECGRALGRGRRRGAGTAVVPAMPTEPRSTEARYGTAPVARERRSRCPMTCRRGEVGEPDQSSVARLSAGWMARVPGTARTTYGLRRATHLGGWLSSWVRWSSRAPPGGAGSPGGVGNVADGGQQDWVHQRGAGAEQHGRDRPQEEGVGGGDEGQRGGLGEHPGDDERFAAVPVRRRPGQELAEAPHAGIDGGEHPDLRDGQAVGGEQHREQAPGQAVVEVVDHAGLADRR